MYWQFRQLFGLPVVQAQDVKASSLPGMILTQAPRRSDMSESTVSEAEIHEALAKETGMDRLNQMFSKDEQGNLSPEMDLVVNCSQNTAFLGLLFGTFTGSRMAVEKFKAANKETVFETKFLASRSYIDWAFLGGVKAGFIWAAKLGFFTFLLIGSSQVISVYRNKSGPLEFVAGGAITGGLMRINLGLKGLVAGGVIGSVFGLFGGTMVYLARLSMNETQEGRHYWTIHDQIQRQKRIKLLQECLPSTKEVTVEAS